MKNLTYKLLLLIFAFVSEQAISQNYYNSTFDFGYYDNPAAFVTDAVESIYTCGWYEDENNQNKKGFVIKTNSNGEELWRVTMNQPSEFYALCITHLGSIAVAGSRNNRCFMAAFNIDNGDELWQYEEEGSDDNWFATVNEVIDSNKYKLQTVKTKLGFHHMWYYLLNPKTGSYLGEYKDTVNSIFGLTYASALMTPQIVWTAGDENGGEGRIFSKNYESGDYYMWHNFMIEHIAGVQKYSENKGCVVDYNRWSANGKYYLDVLTMKFDISEIYGNSFMIPHAEFTITGSGIIKNDKILVTGTISRQLALWFVDYDLTNIQEKIISTENKRSGIDVLGLPSTDIILTGTEEDPVNNGTNLFLMKLNRNGLVSTNENKISAEINLYPNPATNKITIKTNSPKFYNANAIILNSMGEAVKVVSHISNPITIINLPKGLYIVIVLDKNKILHRQKFIKI